MLIKNLFYLLIFSLFLFAACKQGNPDFVGTWKLSTITIDGDVINAKDVNDPVYTFGNDNKYEIAVNGIKEKGTWKLEGDYLILQDSEDPEIEKKMKIIESSQNKFLFSSGEGEYASQVVLVK